MKFRREITLVALLGVLLLAAPAHAARPVVSPNPVKVTIADLLAKVKKFFITTFDDDGLDLPTPPKP